MQWCSYSEAMHKTGKDIEDEDLGLLDHPLAAGSVFGVYKSLGSQPTFTRACAYAEKYGWLARL